MKTILMILILLIGFSAYGTHTLNNTMQLICASTDGATIDYCTLKAKTGSSDSAALNASISDEYTLTGAEQTDIDAILVKAVTNTKSVHSIP